MPTVKSVIEAYRTRINSLYNKVSLLIFFFYENQNRPIHHPKITIVS